MDQQQRRAFADAFVEQIDAIDRRMGHADEYTVVRADTWADTQAMPKVTILRDVRNLSLPARIQSVTWTTQTPLAQPLLR